MDYYNILELSKTATKDEIKKSYRKLAFKYHPDKNQNEEKEECEKKFKEVSEAYSILYDDNKRKSYDMGDNLENFNYNDAFNMFNEIFTKMSPDGTPVKFTVHSFGNINELPFNPIEMLENIMGKGDGEDGINPMDMLSKLMGGNGNPMDILGGLMGGGSKDILGGLMGGGSKDGKTQINPMDILGGLGGLMGNSENFNPMDILGNIKNTNNKSSNKHKSNRKIEKKMEDMEFEIDASLNDLFKNKIKKVAINIKKNKQSEKKILKFPLFYESMRFKGDGSYGSDIIININIKEDNNFKRYNENDLIYESLISLNELYNNGVILINHLDNRKLYVKLSEDIKLIQILEGEGLPYYIDDELKRGNLYIKFIIDLPKLNKENKELIKNIFPSLNNIENCVDLIEKQLK
jgi:DnaJ-class molecular chaperone